MSNVRSPVADPMASTETKILNGTSLAVTRMPLRNVDSFSVNSQDANPPTKDSQEKIIIKGTCDYVITFSSNHQEDFTDFYVLLRNAIVRASLRDAIERLPRLPLDDRTRLPLDDVMDGMLDSLEPAQPIVWTVWTDRTYRTGWTHVIDWTSVGVKQEDLSLSEDREIRAINWPDRCSLKWRLYNSEHPHGGCRFSEPSMWLSIIGVQPRKLRVKDWQDAHGKVGIIDCQCHLRSTESRKALFSALLPRYGRSRDAF